jgi:two-component system, NarL family, sensor histidine kinase UhpB
MYSHHITTIIEDNPGDLLLLKTQLEAAGWPLKNSQDISTLSEAVENLKTHKPSVIIIDLNLPDSNGLETFLTVQGLVPEVPIIILSGTDDTPLSIQAVQAGAQDFLVKGEFEEKLLLKTILYSIERKKAQLKIEDANKRYMYASKATNDPLWDWDINTNEILWNNKVSIFGYPDAVRKNNAWRMNNIHPEDSERIAAKMKELMDNHNDQWIEQYRFRCADATYKYIYDRGFVLRDNNDNPYRMIGTMQDITEQVLLQKKQEDEKEENQKTILKVEIESQEKQRNQIGSELHDNVNQILAAANMHLSLIKKGDEARTFEFVNESKNLIKKAVDEIRKLTHNIDTSHLEDMQLSEALKVLISDINALSVIDIKLNHSIDSIIIPSPVALTVYRIIQEQLNNILKHAEATEVRIQLHAIHDLLKLDIADNGKGADFNTIKRGIGLSNMQNRAKAYDGKVDFFTAPGKGFAVAVEMPLKLSKQ